MVTWRLPCPPRRPIDAGELELALKERLDFGAAGSSGSGALAPGDQVPPQEVGGAPSAQQLPPAAQLKGAGVPAEQPATRKLQKVGGARLGVARLGWPLGQKGGGLYDSMCPF